MANLAVAYSDEESGDGDAVSMRKETCRSQVGTCKRQRSGRDVLPWHSGDGGRRNPSVRNKSSFCQLTDHCFRQSNDDPVVLRTVLVLPLAEGADHTKQQ